MGMDPIVTEFGKHKKISNNGLNNTLTRFNSSGYKE